MTRPRPGSPHEKVGFDKRWGNVSTSLIVPFMTEQWALIAALAVTLMMLVFHETRKAGPALSINEAVQLVNSEGGVFVDIRDAASFEAGNIPQSINLTNENLAQFIGDADMDQPLVVVCYHGISSQNAAQYLNEQGFDEVYSLDGGFQAWREAN